MSHPTPTTVDAISQWARETPNRLALVELAGGRRRTYRELWSHAEAWAAAVARLGGAHAPVAVVVPGACEFFEVALGIEHVHGVLAALSPDLPRAELRRLLGFIEARVIIATPEVLARLEPAEVPTCAGVIPARVGHAPEAEPWARAPEPCSYDVPPHWARLRFTSGTLAQPRVVVRSITSERHILARGLERFRYGPDDVVVSSNRAAAEAPMASSVLNAGGTYVSAAGLDPLRFAHAIAATRSAVAFALPWVFRRWAGREEVHPLLRGLRFGVRIGPLPSAAARTLYERCAFLPVNAYGSSEAGGGEFRFPTTWMEGKMDSLGRALPGAQLRLVVESGRPAAPAEPGELWVGGPGVMEGYLKDPEATEAVLRDGWVRSGDLFTRDADGYYRIVGRIKAIISVAGRKVHPEEVEAVLLEHPAVEQAAVVGVEDPLRGERVQALVVLREGRTATPGDLRGFCRGVLAPYKVPRSIVFVDALPTTRYGRVARGGLQETRAR